VDRLLLVGMLTDEDVIKLLIMIDPETWDESFQKGNFCMCVVILYKS
jgi:ryanodine receptor 2